MTTKMYHPDTQDTKEVADHDVADHQSQGYVTVGDRPESDYLGKAREDLDGGESDQPKRAAKKAK